MQLDAVATAELGDSRGRRIIRQDGAVVWKDIPEILEFPRALSRTSDNAQATAQRVVLDYLTPAICEPKLPS